jgi:uncharacterized protein (TIGR03435 family)
MMADIINHLWQSTLFAGVVALLAVAFRRNQARIRYWLWLTASMKFMVPFATLADLGSRVNWLDAPPSDLGSRLDWLPALPPLASTAVSSTLLGVGQALTESAPELPAGLPVSASSDSLGLVLAGVWIGGFVAIVASRTRAWWRIRAAVRASVDWDGTTQAPAGVRLRVTSSLLEPGVVGLWRPVILLPAGIDAFLTPRQLDAVLAHEICHIRRRDNLTALLHMTVEAVCWFHPVVWWIGARLLHERERACDEHVLRKLGEPAAYAHGIVNVCRRYVETPLMSVTGVGGADIKARLEAILSNHVGVRLSWPGRVALTAAAVAAIALPIAAGAGATALRPQEQEPILDAAFDVASFKRNVSNDGNITFRPEPTGEFTVINMPLIRLVAGAYQLQYDQVIGAPAWAQDEKYDILAKLDPKIARRSQPDGHPPTWALALRNLLAERTHLAFHRETRQLPVYALVMARADRRLGPNIKPAQVDCEVLRPQAEVAAREGKPSPYPPRTLTYVPCGMRNAPGRIVSGGFGFAEFMGALSVQMGRPVVDRTGLSGRWDFYLEYAPTPITAGATADSNHPDLFTAMQEQLGLKLESTQGPVQVFVIDRLERPTAD